jgi:hypothetical protein
MHACTDGQINISSIFRDKLSLQGSSYKNLTFDTLNTQHVLRWYTKIEEFSPILPYIEGPHNILADNLSSLHCLVTPAQIAEGKKLVELAEVSIEEEDEAYFLDQEYSGLYNEDIWECIECYLNLPDTPHPDENLLIMHTFMNCSNRMNNCLLYK